MMTRSFPSIHRTRHWCMFLLLLMTSCSPSGLAGSLGNRDQAPTPNGTSQHTDPALAAADTFPMLTPVTLAAGEKLQVVASTSLVADVVAQIGGDQITLYALMGAGVDPHSYTPTPQDLRSLDDAQVVFINGLHLEENLTHLLANVNAPVVPVRVGVPTHEISTDEEHTDEEHTDEEHTDEEQAEHADADHNAEAHAEAHHHEGADPHTWQRVGNVKIWVENIQRALRELDPAHADHYTAAATTYQAQLDALDAEIRTKVATIPTANRKLVTDHETFGYFAAEYGFTIVGALMPSLSTAAEPSAQSLAALQDQLAAEGVKAIFVGTTVNPRLAEQLAQDLGIQVVVLYSDALSAADGPAATYLDFMRYNLDAIVGALK
ncbi:MAG: zinc ABC transporter substrate-binding protein [Caldilineaceae bacterium]|nr:zinc ABC transporter substrate-binding protein [Caldilineaceae bacterium]